MSGIAFFLVCLVIARIIESVITKKEYKEYQKEDEQETGRAKEKIPGTIR